MKGSHLTAIDGEVIDRMNYAGESLGKIAIEVCQFARTKAEPGFDRELFGTGGWWKIGLTSR